MEHRHFFGLIYGCTFFGVGHKEQGGIPPSLPTKVTDPAVGGRLAVITGSLDNLGRLERYSCLCKRGPIQAASSLEGHHRLDEKDTLEMGSGININ